MNLRSTPGILKPAVVFAIELYSSQVGASPHYRILPTGFHKTGIIFYRNMETLIFQEILSFRPVNPATAPKEDRFKMRAKRSSYDQRFSRYKFGGFSAIFGGFGTLCHSITFRTDILHRNVAFLPKLRAKRSSYEKRFSRYDSGDFRRFLAVFGGF